MESLNLTRKKTKINKKPLFFLLLLLSISIIGGTIAYFSNKERFNNEFKTAGYNVAIEEEFYGEFGTKKVNIVNKDDADVILRVSYNELWSKGDLILSSEINGTEVVTKSWTQNWLSDFTDGGDGWYYYKKILESKSSIQILNSIAFNDTLAKTSSDYEYYKNYDYDLTFNYEAVQATSDAVQELWGHNATIDGNNVTWSF